MQRSDVLMDLGCTLNPVIDIGQIEGAFVQGMGWCTMEECVWGDKAHKWVRRRLCSSTGHATWWCNTPLLRVQMKPGSLLTRGPGFYKIPSFNDVPIDFRISLLADAPNPAVRVYVCCARARLVSCLCSLEWLNLSSCATCRCCLFRLCTPPRPWVSRRSSWLPPCSSPSRMPSTPPAKKAAWKATSRWTCQPPPSAFAWRARTRLWLAALAVQKLRRRTVCPAASKQVSLPLGVAVWLWLGAEFALLQIHGVFLHHMLLVIHCPLLTHARYSCITTAHAAAIVCVASTQSQPVLAATVVVAVVCHGKHACRCATPAARRWHVGPRHTAPHPHAVHEQRQVHDGAVHKAKVTATPSPVHMHRPRSALLLFPASQPGRKPLRHGLVVRLGGGLIQRTPVRSQSHMLGPAGGV